AFREEYDKSRFDGIELLSYQKQGSVANLIARGDREAAAGKIAAMKPVLFEILPLTLEEVFLYEMSAIGYGDALKTDGEGGEAR
ncbi:MAG: ABC transporter ATP-binding protein, partial [Clostridia bacterium]|nr:ABC transporter ATP-binding protein [Clostridia bacterium]